jgi:hypothetical protein
MLTALFLLSSQPAHSGEVIDGIAATVNGVAILRSDVDEALRVEAFLEGRPPGPVTAAQQEAVLQRLIDQELLRQQMAGAFAPPKPEELAERMRQVKCRVAPGTCATERPRADVLPAQDQSWQAALSRYGLSEEALTGRMAAQMQLAAFLEWRLQLSAPVDAASIQAYYQEKLLPELRRQGTLTEPPFAQVSPQIAEILRQQRMDQMLDSWLQELHRQSRIRTGPDPEPAPAASTGWRNQGAAIAPGR